MGLIGTAWARVLGDSATANHAWKFQKFVRRRGRVLSPDEQENARLFKCEACQAQIVCVPGLLGDREPPTATDGYPCEQAL